MLRLTLMLFVILSSSFAFSADKITIAYLDVEVFPYFMGNGLKVANPPGLVVDVITKASENIGEEVDFVRYPAKRVLYYIKAERTDGAFIFSFSKERAAYCVYPMKDGKPNIEKRLTTQSYYLYKLKDSLLEWDGVRIDNSKCNNENRNTFAANLGFSVVQTLEILNLKVIEKKLTPHLFKLLQERVVIAVAAHEIILHNCF